MQFFHDIRVCRVIDKVASSCIPHIVIDYGTGQCRVPESSLRPDYGETMEAVTIGDIIIACINYRYSHNHWARTWREYTGIIIWLQKPDWPVGTRLVLEGYNYVYREPSGRYGLRFKMGFDIKSVGQTLLSTVREEVMHFDEWAKLDGLRLVPETF